MVGKTIFPFGSGTFSGANCSTSGGILLSGLNTARNSGNVPIELQGVHILGSYNQSKLEETEVK